MKTQTATIKIDGKEIILETGLLAVQAAGAVTARCGDTLVLATVVNGQPREGLDYFPLQVEYREKHYAGGVISSSRFIKRESRPSDNEILTARLIDRSIRPLFPDNYYDEVQVFVHPLSIDGKNEPEILSLIASSAALAISPLPWAGPVGSVRVGLGEKNKLIFNPTNQQKQNSSLDLVISGTQDSIAMVEAGAQEVSEKQILEALKTSQKYLKTIVQGINELVQKIKPAKIEVSTTKPDPDLVKLIKKHIKDPLTIARQEATKTGHRLEIIKAILNQYPDLDAQLLAKTLEQIIKKEVRQQILTKNIRPDNRKIDQIRDINSQVGLLPRVHGSALFQRGLTHALSIVTLASPDREQLIEGMKGEETKRYFHHYNMPGYSVGEPSRIGYPARREVGHGALANRALEPVIPPESDFPYTIRVVTEVVSSNGSTSQASVCGSTLALMDAGVPIKKPVAGIAMGLITADDKFITLSDISGFEDHVGDMDFKVAGTQDGITAMQMDVKVPGVSPKVLTQALDQARLGRLHILKEMEKTIAKPRPDISPYAPHIQILTIDQEKIGEVIGPGGRIIRQLQKDYDVEISIDDDGQVSIAADSTDKVNKAKTYIQGLVAEAEIGKIYQGKVTRVESYGAFVEILPGKQGLIHISKLGQGYVNKTSDVVKVGDTLEVKVYEIDAQGRINLATVNQSPSANNQNPPSRPKRDSSFKIGNRPAKRFKDHR